MRNPRVDFGHSWCPISQTRFNTHIRPIHYSRRKVGLPEQLSLFADRSSRPKGLRYAEEFVSPTAEKTLIGHIAALPLQPFQFGQCEGKRRVASFGFRYDYTLRRLEEADPIPEWLESIVENFEAGRRVEEPIVQASLAQPPPIPPPRRGET